MSDNSTLYLSNFLRLVPNPARRVRTEFENLFDAWDTSPRNGNLLKLIADRSCTSFVAVIFQSLNAAETGGECGGRI